MLGRLRGESLTLDEFLNNEEKLLGKLQTATLLSRFKEKYLAADYDPKNQRRSWLYNCNLSCEARWISTDDFGTIIMDRDKLVFFYSERDRKMFAVTFGEIFDLIADFEPWDEVDALVFDNSLDWLVVINHEDITGLHNVETGEARTRAVTDAPFGSKRENG